MLHVFESICERGDALVGEKRRSGFNLNCRIYSSGYAMGLRIHKPLSLRLLEPPVGPSGSPSVLPVCPLAALSRTERDSAQKLCNKRREVRAFHVKSLPNEKWHVCKLSVHFGPVTQSPRGGRKVAGLIPAWLFLLVDGCPSLCVADGGSG